MLESVLIANRGEIAVRVIRTAQRLGVRAVAVYSDADARAPHVLAADEAVRLGPAPAGESYLSVERVLAAAEAAQVDAVHPGYGFLSENAGFARAVADAGLTFVGPSGDAMDALGDKYKAKQAAHAADVPVLEGLEKDDLTDEEILAFGEDESIYPIMVKAVAGGGGRGMRVVEEQAKLKDAIGSARSEAKSGFGNDALLVERFVPKARHVEVQVFADTHGNAIHLGERECSLQRRHQKVVEESPSPAIRTREKLGTAAVNLFKEAGYVGAGTAEFLVPHDATDEFYFLEVNARLQVEHPVTEAVTGLDLVELQLRIASGEELGLTQDEVRLDGHAVEVRVCAEDPASGFLPATGEVVVYAEPHGVRTDSGIRAGSEITTLYDSLLAKVIAHAEDRTTALENVSRGLDGLRIMGVTTNAGFLKRLVNAQAVRDGDMDTGLIERGVADAEADEDAVGEAALALAAIENLLLYEHDGDADPWDTLIGFRLDGPAPLDFRLATPRADDPLLVRVTGAPGAASLVLGEDETQINAWRIDAERVALQTGNSRRVWTYAAAGQDRWVAAGADSFHFDLLQPVVEGADAHSEGELEAPMPGTVLSVKVAEGDEVSEGDTLIVIESMKMELSITAPGDATVQAVHVAEGDGVKQGQTLIELEVEE